MNAIERYRRLASEAMAKSRETIDTRHRSAWLEISDSWESLANEQSGTSEAPAETVERRVS